MVTLYSIYLPIISLVCASSPGRAEKKNPTTGSKINSKGAKILRHRGRSFTFGLALRSMSTIADRLMSDKVRMAEDTCGSVFPITVLEKVVFNSGGIFAPTVIINQFTGHIK